MENDFAVHCCTVFSECEMHLFSSSMMEKYCACFLLLAPSAPALKLWRFLPLLCNNTLLFYSRCFWSDQGSTPKFLSFLWRTVLAFQNSFGADTTSVSSFLSWTHFFFRAVLLVLDFLMQAICFDFFWFSVEDKTNLVGVTFSP